MLNFVKINVDILAAWVAIFLGLILITIGVTAWAGLAQACIAVGIIIIGLVVIIRLLV